MMWVASKQSIITQLDTWKATSTHVIATEAHVAERFVTASYWPFDNASQHCQGLEAAALCGECPDQHVIWRLLHWAKLIVLKISRNYYAFPVILVLLPLTIGLAFGFLYGRRWERKQQELRSPHVRHVGLNVSRLSVVIGMGRGLLETLLKPWQSPVCDKPDFVSNCSRREPYPETEMDEREIAARDKVRRTQENIRESGVELSLLPKHVAVVMDGNRRHGKAVHGDATAGHFDGSRKLLEFSKWCLAERIKVLTVYAFSTENWCRDPAEISALMSLFIKYCDELCIEALERNIRVRVLSSETAQIPSNVKHGLNRLEEETRSCSGEMLLNVCISYGSRGEILDACRSLAKDCAQGKLSADHITEADFGQRLLTNHCPDPDILIRTSGEVRISNFLLWQLAYTEMFFLDKNWPEIQKDDLLSIIQKYAMGRQRRFGR